MSIQRIGVIGAGLMGNGIAQVSAQAGLAVTMIDVSESAIQKGLATIAATLERLVHKGKLSVADRTEVLARIDATTDYEALQDADLAIEAATENL